MTHIYKAISVFIESRRVKRDLLFFSVAAFVAALDQITKSLVRAYLPIGQSIPEDGFVRLTHVTNTGAAFGILQGQGSFILVSTFIGVAAILVYYVFPPVSSSILGISLGLQLGGAVGNLLDRVRYGSVTDFFDLRVWPVFNIADSSIVVGVTLLAALVLLSERRERASREKAHEL